MGKPNYALRYINLREQRAVFAEQRLSEDLNEIRSKRTELTEISQILGDHRELPVTERGEHARRAEVLQREISTLQAECSRLNVIQLSPPPRREELLQEFRSIRSLPSVHAVRVTRSKELVVAIGARLEYEGARYHLGDWNLVLNLFNDKFKTVEVVSGLMPDIRNDDERRYLQYSWDFGFCFGENDTYVEGFIQAGEYVTALKMAVAYMNDVNPDHLELIDQVYRKV